MHHEAIQDSSILAVASAEAPPDPRMRWTPRGEDRHRQMTGITRSHFCDTPSGHSALGLRHTGTSETIMEALGSKQEQAQKPRLSTKKELEAKKLWQAHYD